MRDGEQIRGNFGDQHECILSLKLTSRGRDNWPDEKDEQGYKLQDEKTEAKGKRGETKVKDRKGKCQ